MSKLYKNSIEENIFENILKVVEDGIMSLLLTSEEIDKIDNENKSYNNYNVDSTNNIINRFYINEYIVVFNFYTKNMTDKKTPSNSNYLEVEYIFSNENNDKESLNNILLKILLIRQGLNIFYLMTSNE